MGINIRTKGQSGEREICDWLNSITHRILEEEGFSLPERPIFQRNQNQSAVGGSDITNPFGLCIEVKRQESLNLNEWWKQCAEAAKQFGGKPLVLYRQNGKRKWRALLEADFYYQCGQAFSTFRCEIQHEDFERFVHSWIKRIIINDPKMFNNLR